MTFKPSFSSKRSKEMNRLMKMLLALAITGLLAAQPAMAADEHLLDQDAAAALKSLYSNHSGAKALGDKAIGVLVFPNITKAGFILGAQGGAGTLFEKGKITGHYHAGALSVGMQAGVQTYGYALFFMAAPDLAYLKKTSGWSLGVGPSIVVADAGFGKDLSTLTGQKGVYAFIFDQSGLMAGMGLVGQKISVLK
jgi:lipid-binding SYLF domain-containing protein